MGSRRGLPVLLQFATAYLSDCFFGPPVIAAAVTTTWLTLRAARAWRPARGTWDRLGLGVAVGHLILFLAITIFLILSA